MRWWLRERIWPLAVAHDATSLRTSALEIVNGGTTPAQVMERVDA
jgi:hypothetical protein